MRRLRAKIEKEDCAETLYIVAAFLLFDGKENEHTFEVMNEEGAFARILDLINDFKDQGVALHRMLLQLFYEMSRIQRIRNQDLCVYIAPCSEDLAGTNRLFKYS